MGLGQPCCQDVRQAWPCLLAPPAYPSACAPFISAPQRQGWRPLISQLSRMGGHLCGAEGLGLLPPKTQVLQNCCWGLWGMCGPKGRGAEALHFYLFFVLICYRAHALTGKREGRREREKASSLGGGVGGRHWVAMLQSLRGSSLPPSLRTVLPGLGALHRPFLLQGLGVLSLALLLSSSSSAGDCHLLLACMEGHV